MLSSPPKKHLFAWFSIRTQLIVLLIGIAGFLIYDRAREIGADREREIARATREIFTTAQRGAQREAELIASAKAVLTLAARDPAVENNSATACRAPFQSVTSVMPLLDDMSVISRAGGLVCTSSRMTTSRGVADRPYFQAVMRTREFAISDFLTSRLTSRPVVVAAMPRIEGGEVASVLVASINADWFTRVARAASGLETSEVMLLNRAGDVVSTSTRLTHWVGRSLAENAALWTKLNGPDGVIEAITFDGVKRIVGHIRLPGTKGLLLVMRSHEAVLGAANAQAWRALTTIFGIGLACLLLVWFGGRLFILQPLEALGAAAKRLGDGDLSARVDTRKLAPELATLGEAFNSMSSLLAQRDEQLRNANARLSDLAATDGLTGIANKRQFTEQLEAEWRRGIRTGTPVALVLLDVDFFKKFNDRYGHVAGDECLERVAGVLKKACRRPGDMAARTGGEEFAVLLPGAQMEDALAIAESIRLAIRSLRIPHADSATGLITASLGVASFMPNAGQSTLTLLNAADAALYRAKHHGRNRVMLHGPVALAS